MRIEEVRFHSFLNDRTLPLSYLTYGRWERQQAVGRRQWWEGQKADGRKPQRGNRES
jgi:hypothetical protein